MSDEKIDEHEDIELLWENIPREARLVVYEHLRTVMASHHKDSAMASLLHSVTKEPATSPNPVAVLHAVAGMAFLSALRTLEASDTELCLECGSYHDDEFAHVPSTNPKDLS